MSSGNPGRARVRTPHGSAPAYSFPPDASNRNHHEFFAGRPAQIIQTVQPFPVQIRFFMVIIHLLITIGLIFCLYDLSASGIYQKSAFGGSDTYHILFIIL